MNNSTSHTIVLGDQPWSIGLSPDRHTALVAGERLHQVNLIEQTVAPIDMEGLDCSGLVAQAPNGHFAIIDNERGLLAVFEKNFNVLNVIQHADLKAADNLHISADGNKVVTESIEEMLIVWDVGKGSESYRWTNANDVSAPNRTFVALSTDYIEDILIYAENDKLVFSHLNHNIVDTVVLDADIFYVHHSVNQRYALLMSKTGESFILDVAQRAVEPFGRLPVADVCAAAVNDDGTLVATHAPNQDQNSGILLVIDRETNNITQVDTDTSHVDCIRFIDDFTVLYGTDDGLVYYQLPTESVDSMSTTDAVNEPSENVAPNAKPERKTIIDDALLEDPYEDGVDPYAEPDSNFTPLIIGGAVILGVILILLNM